MEINNVLSISLKGKLILLTGGYGYLGEEIAKNLLEHGAVVIIGGRSKKKFNTVFKHKNEKLFFQYLDVSDENSIKSFLDAVSKKFGKFDGIINNAFYLSGNSPNYMTNEDFNKGIEGTLTSVFLCIKNAIPYFLENGYGKIVNVSSMYGIQAPDFEVYEESMKFLNPPHYGAAKAGVVQLSKYYASYLGKKNILVNCVVPGAFPSNIVQKDKFFIKKLSEKTALGRIGKPEELGGIFTFLMSDASNYITGQNFVVDGGWTIK